jgi:hypothetical protein
MLCNAALMDRLSNFYSSFKQNFSRIFCSSFKLFQKQTVRLSRVHCTLKLISRPPDRRPVSRVEVRHANLPDRLRVKTPVYLHCIRRRSRTRLRFCRCMCKRPYCPFTNRSYNTPKPFQCTFLNYSYNIRRFTFIIRFLVHFYSPGIIFDMLANIIFLKTFLSPSCGNVVEGSSCVNCLEGLRKVTKTLSGPPGRRIQ